ncbi:MAG: SDR family oxidoreductase [Actinomyces sp.]|nr:MAG: SDR family oxidoreductase [Actinomyces sp.]
MDIEGRVVVVTGGGSGIGEALARAFAGAGAAHVVVADLDGHAARRVAAGIGGTGVQVDVSDADAIVDLVDGTEAAHGPIGVFASNAGYVTLGGLEDTDERIQHMWDVHVMAHIRAARAVIPQMVANGGGYLLNTASAAGLLTQIGSLAYSVTKHAAVAVAEWVAISHHHQGIRVSVLCPQAVRTNIVANSPDARAMGGDELNTGVASGDGVVEPDQVARLCLEAMAEERFWVLPHPEVAEYVQRKATDVDRWLAGMRRLQAALYGDGPLPGDALVADLPGR